MKTSKHISKGSMHKVFCEDFLIEHQINEKLKIYGVFDGCSSGKNSHFASALFGKSIISAAEWMVFNNNQVILKKIVYQAFSLIDETKDILNLQTEELLSTIIVMLINEETKKADILAIGDGLVSVNHQITNIDQNNQPDYPIYHFDEIKTFDDFSEYYSKQLAFLNVDVEDITISTDGINSFMLQGQNSAEDFNVIDYFVKDEFLKGNPAMLSRKHNIISKKYSLENTDDLAIIRVIS